MSKLNNVSLKDQIMRFIISGCTVACVGIATLYILVDVLKFWYLTASVFAFFLTIIVNFFMQKTWTFEDGSKKIKTQMSLFLVNSLFNLALNTAFMYVMVGIIGIHHLLSQALVMVALALMNYTIYRLYIFKTPALDSPNTL